MKPKGLTMVKVMFKNGRSRCSKNVILFFSLLFEESQMFQQLSIYCILLVEIDIFPISQLHIIAKVNFYYQFWLKMKHQPYVVMFYCLTSTSLYFFFSTTTTKCKLTKIQKRERTYQQMRRFKHFLETESRWRIAR